MSDEKIEQCRAWIETLEDPGERFTFTRIIGQGNSAAVHQCEDQEGRTVAVKVVDECDDTLEDLYEEYSILNDLCRDNPRFPTFYGAYRVSSSNPRQVWFAMELCEEGSVHDLLLKLKPKDRVLKEETIAYIIKEVLLSLTQLHEKAIIHRNVKAANILINKDGDIKLSDFGLARRLETPESKIQSVAGSPYWMAPEVVVSERSPDLAYDTRADVWSLGITAAELGDGAAPLSEVYAPRAIFQVVQNPPPTLKKVSDWSQLYNDFISEALEKNPDHRPWSAEMLEHPFIAEKAADSSQLRASLLHMINEVRNDPPAPKQNEVTIKSEWIKLNRKQAPQRLNRDDLATLYKVNEDSVIENLHQRFAQGNIYTYLGDILILINPFGLEKFGKLYNLEMAAKYKYKSRGDNAPHIYGIADRAYQDMLHHKEIQNIILTGETGSGKTTAGKHVLWHLTNMTASNKKMIDRIMKVQTVMHAFGNASTIFNESSTRYIQYMELTFTKTGKLSGGILTTYNLEKWRVTSRGRNQSNFHIFYYLMDTLCATDQTGKYYLTRGANYEYLPECPNHVPKDNIENLRQVKEAFNVLDFSLEEQETIVKILSAILLIGQIRFDGEDEACIENKSIVEKVASLLDVDAKKLEWTFTNFCLVTSGEAVRGKCNRGEALEMRDSLARSLYCRLVDWIVNLINTKLSFTRLVFGDQNSLGLLDIPGFECFANDNTLDQFLINMTNEQMQFFYNQRVFIWEMEDCEKEELSTTNYNFHDNRELLDIVLSKPAGLLAFLDDETKGNTNDHQNFVGQLKNSFQTRFIRKAEDSNFTVAHYSGQVVYDARNFIERNKNFLSPEMIQVMRLSTNATVVQLYSNQMTKTGNLTITDEDVQQTRWTTAIAQTSQKSKGFNTKSKGKFSQSRQMQTIASTTRNSLLDLLTRVSQGSAHFIRCLRSNLKCEQMSFDRDLISYQLRALGIVDSIRVRQLGYSRRLRFAEFLRRYKFLAFDFDETVEETRENCRLLLIRLKMEGWALGNNKVFLKYYNEEFLSRLYEDQVHKVIKVQSMMRAFLARKRTTNKFPRLAAIRQAAAASNEKHMYPGLCGKGKNAVYSSKDNSLRPGQFLGANGAAPTYSGNSTRNTTPVLFEGNEPARPTGFSGYNQVYSSKSKSPSPQHLNYRQHQYPQSNQQSHYNAELPPVVNRRPSHSDYRQKSPTSPSASYGQRLNANESEIDTGRPPSPRDIAKAFEAAARENELSALAGRNRPGNNRGSVSPMRSAGQSYSSSNSRSNPQSQQFTGSNQSHPEIINPMEQFTNMANNQGPYNYRGGLRKTGMSNNNNRDFGQLGLNLPNRANNGNEYRNAAPQRINSQERVMISPGFVVEGVCEDL